MIVMAMATKGQCQKALTAMTDTSYGHENKSKLTNLAIW